MIPLATFSMLVGGPGVPFGSGLGVGTSSAGIEALALALVPALLVPVRFFPPTAGQEFPAIASVFQEPAAGGVIDDAGDLAEIEGRSNLQRRDYNENMFPYSYREGRGRGL